MIEGETLAACLKRLKTVDQTIFDRVFWAADKLVDSGYMTIYNDSRDIIGSVLHENQSQEEEEDVWGEDPNGAYQQPMAEMMWEYTTEPPSVNVCKGGLNNTDGEVHGPFPTSQMREWNRLSYFTTERMWLRRAGQEWMFRKGQDLDELFSIHNSQNLPGA